jgi:nucleotide-binding universal stress UspA family protein
MARQLRIAHSVRPETTTLTGRILCPIDFDVNSLAALDFASSLARFRGKLFVLHVAPSTAGARSGPMPLLLDRVNHSFAQIRLEKMARESLRDLDHQLIVKSGRPAEQILAAVTELRPHLLVMATHSRAGSSASTLGSVAEAVICEASCPVLTIHDTSRHDWPELGPIRGAYSSGSR